MERTFAERFAVAPECMSTFRGRLQHLQRQKSFPDGVNTGKGKKAVYGWRQLLQLTVALDLIDLGLTPEVAVERVRSQSGVDRLIRAAYEVSHRFSGVTALSEAIEATHCPLEKTAYVLTSAAALSFSDSRDKPYLIVIDGGALISRLRDDPAITPAEGMIDFGSRIMLVSRIVADVTGQAIGAVAEDLRGWTHQERHREVEN
jgi:hypothetical protein